MSSLSPLLRLSGLVAALLFVLAVLGFGAGLEGYAQARHPVALLGAQGVPHALAFNLLGFVLPGLLAVVVAECLRRGLSATAGWAPRVGRRASPPASRWVALGAPAGLVFPRARRARPRRGGPPAGGGKKATIGRLRNLIKR